MSQGSFGRQLDFDAQRLKKKINPPSCSWRLVTIVAVAILALTLVFTSFYQIDPEEVGVVLRFGAFQRETQPGLHLKLPFGIETVYAVPVQRQLNQEFGFRTLESGVRSRFESRPEESVMLTGDLNVAVVEWVVQYRIVDPYRYLFKVRNVDETFRDMSEAVMRQVVGDRTVNEVITVGRQDIAKVAEESLQALSEQYEMGVEVDQVVLQDVTPPERVRPAFNEVNQAQQERARLINEAQSDYNKEVPRARGEAEQTILQAEGYAVDRVNRAEGEANKFNQVYATYSKAPEVTRRRLYLETLGNVLPKAGRRVVVSEDVSGLLPLLDLSNSPIVGNQPSRSTAGGGGGGER